MNLYQINIRPSGSYYSSIKGDMLFGMFCWVIVDNFGEERLKKCLDGYMQNRPFVVFSDAFPCGYLPKPTLPFIYYENMEKQQNDNDSSEAVRKRKENKRKNWLPADKIGVPTIQMSEMFVEVGYISKDLRTMVHLDPVSQHTSGGQYSAYTAEQLTYTKDLSLYILIDEERISTEEVRILLEYIGQIGYGKKAAAGNGKFELLGDLKKVEFVKQASSSFLTLAPCIPPLNTFDTDRSFYHIFVRFGKHGNVAACSANPFKKPIMTADTGAVFTFAEGKMPDKVEFIGSAVSNISVAEPTTVFQGYAPVVPLNLGEKKDDK